MTTTMTTMWRAGLVVAMLAWSAGAMSGQTRPPDRLVERTANLDVRDVALVDALRALQARSGVPISFSPESLPAGRRVWCDCRDRTVADALRTVLAGTDLTFLERASQILIVPTGQSGTVPAGALVGTVREPEGGAPIRSAFVELRERGASTLTDARGNFVFLSLPEGSYHLDVRALGFRPLEGIAASVGASDPTRLTLELTPDPLALAEIVVTPGTFGMLGDPTLSAQTLSREEMAGLPQLGEDVFRTMERVPGVATDDISAKMNVRGGNDDELLIMLDGIELFEPYHLRDLDAVLGVVDVATLRGVDLVAGGLPTEHGDRMSGLLDMRTQQPIGGGTRSSIGMSASNVTFRTRGSFADERGGWLLSGRRGFLDLLLAMAEATEEGSNDGLSPSYFDVMGKVELLAGPDHRLSAHVLYAGDDLDIEADDPPDEHAFLSSDWTNLNAWATWRWRVTPSLDVSTVVSASDLSRIREGEYVSPGSSEVADFAYVSDHGDFTFATARQDWRVAVAEGVVVKLGGQVRSARSEYRYLSRVGEELLAGREIGVTYDTVDVTLSPSATESTAYLAGRLRPVEPFTLEAGLRYDHRSHTGDSDVSPRLLAALSVGAATVVRASWGKQRQSHGVEELSVVDGDTIFFPSEVATQAAIGIEHRLGAGVEARVEAYERRVADPRPRYLNVGREIIPFPEIGNDRVRFLPERGRARGIELLLNARRGGTEWSGSYVVSRAEDRADGTWVPRTLDQRHTVNLHWSHAPSDRWRLSAGWQFHTGWPSTPMEFQVDTVPGAEPEERSLLIRERPGAINSARLPAYHRLDVRATRTWDVGRGRLSVFLDVFNLYNRRNLRSFDYGVRLPQGEVVRRDGESLLPLLPSFGFTWEF